MSPRRRRNHENESHSPKEHCYPEMRNRTISIQTMSSRHFMAEQKSQEKCLQSAASLPMLKLKGWTDAETPAFQTARTAFGPAEQFRTQSIGGAKDTTTQKNADSVTLYENLLTIQNAADLEWSAADPANVGVRGEFLVGIFPLNHGRNHTPPTPSAAPAK
jgi:hypothetical protein